MSREIVIRKRDDLDPALDADETLEFTFGGVAYQVDVCTKNGDVFRDFLQPYMECAFEKTRIKGAKAKVAADSGALPEAVRERVKKWAKSNGLAEAVEGGGMMKPDVRSAYYDATGDEEALSSSVIAWREKQERAKIRDWARDNDIEIRGAIIPKKVVAAYMEAHPSLNVQPIKQDQDDEFGGDYHAKAGKTAKNLAIPDKALRAAIREWAIANGYEPGERGFIPGEIQDAYHQHLLEQKRGKGVAV